MNDPNAPRKPCPFCGCEEDGLVLDGLGVTHDCTGWIEWNAWNDRPIEDAKDAEIAALKAEVAADQARYYQLLFAVEKRYPNESRHETALRYIREAEMATSDSTNTATSGGEGGAT